jgi:hypothetical protein
MPDRLPRPVFFLGTVVRIDQEIDGLLPGRSLFVKQLEVDEFAIRVAYRARLHRRSRPGGDAATLCQGALARRRAERLATRWSPARTHGGVNRPEQPPAATVGFPGKALRASGSARAYLAWRGLAFLIVAVVLFVL